MFSGQWKSHNVLKIVTVQANKLFQLVANEKSALKYIYLSLFTNAYSGLKFYDEHKRLVPKNMLIYVIRFDNNKRFSSILQENFQI